jgi:hypothetical protein
VISVMFMMKKMVLVILLITGLYIGTVAAIPVIPEEWYGSVVLDGNPAPAGTVIIVQVNGNNSGQLTTTEQGLYGSQTGQNNLFAQINDQEFTKGTPTVTFLVNGIQADQAVPYQSGNLTNLDIYADSKAAPTSPPTLAPSGSSGAVSGSSQPSAGGFPVISVPTTASGVQGTAKPGNAAGTTQAGSYATGPNPPAGQKTTGVAGNSPLSVNASASTGSSGSLPFAMTAGVLVVVVIIVIAVAYLMRKKGKL